MLLRCARHPQVHKKVGIWGLLCCYCLETHMKMWDWTHAQANIALKLTYKWKFCLLLVLYQQLATVSKYKESETLNDIQSLVFQFKVHCNFHFASQSELRDYNSEVFNVRPVVLRTLYFAPQFLYIFHWPCRFWVM